MNRYILPYIIDDLKNKMVFIGGPRQCGKTTLANALIEKYNLEFQQDNHYFNWDDSDGRNSILKKQWKNDDKLLVFDELHKYPRWKTWIKGLFDTQKALHQFLVTGSARLDLYKKGGDSLMGRYHYWRLHPFTLDEKPTNMSLDEAFNRLMTVGGFPEPFLSGDEREARRWRRERFDKIIRDDIRELETIRNISALEMYTQSLRQRVGGLIEFANIALDLQVAPKTLKNWLEILEKMYLCFRVTPYSVGMPRATQKSSKVFFFDNADIVSDSPSAKLENLVATHLLKRVHFLEDYEGYNMGLHFIRDKEKREVDFVIVKDKKVDTLIEVKQSDSQVSTSLKYYTEKLKPKHSIQLVQNLEKPYDDFKTGIQVRRIQDYFSKPVW